MTRKFYLAEAIRTIQTPWWKLWCAILFGKKTIEDEFYRDRVCTIHTWRGKRYLTGYVSGFKKAASP